MKNQNSRRDFLKSAMAGAVAIGGAGAAGAAAPFVSPSGKVLRGVFPIGWSPCTLDNKLDLAAMADQIKFLNRGKVAGVCWPQLASAWSTLSDKEWDDGADALLSVKGKTAVVLGVQTVGFDTDKSVARAKAAQTKGADAIMSLPPPGASDDAVIAYYKTLGSATRLPLVAQAVGKESLDLVVEIARQVPSLVAVKDEAGDPLERAPMLLSRTGGKVEDFCGDDGNKLFSELRAGFVGICPHVGLSDVVQRIFNLYMAGDKKAAFDLYGRFGQFLAFDMIPGANEYVMTLRGVFKEGTIMRTLPGNGSEPPPLTEGQKLAIRDVLTLLKPYLVA